MDELMSLLLRRASSWPGDKLSGFVTEMRERSSNARNVSSASISQNRFDRAIDSFLTQDPRSLARSDLRALTFSLGTPHESLGGSSVSEHSRLGDLLGALTAVFRETYWLGAFKAYMTLPTSSQGFSLLRMWLKSTSARLNSRDRTPIWWASLATHLGLLERSPVGPYVDEWWAGRSERIAHLQDTINIPRSSWLWTAVVDAATQRTCGLSEDEALNLRTRRLFELSDRLGFLAGETPEGDRVLSEVLRRWVRIPGQPREEDLLQRALAAWGNPQLGMAGEAHRWSDAGAEVVTMVCGWVAEEDLKDFHELTRHSGHVDDERLAYWLRFKKQISYTQLVIGDTILRSSDPDIARFRKRKGKRLARLLASTSSNNAIIIRLGDIWIVEFSETGNAAYPYHSKALPLRPGTSMFHLGELKNKNLTWPVPDTRLSHVHDWKAKFDLYLSEQGIWSDQMNRSSARTTASVTVVDGRNATSQVRNSFDNRANISPLARQERVAFATQFFMAAGLPRAFASTLATEGGVLDDQRKKGGKLWIRFPSRVTGAVLTGLRDHGFKALTTTDAFWRP